VARKPIAVIDIGSNSCRIVVLRASGGHLEILVDSRAPLRLERDLQADGALSPHALDRTAAVMRDFGAIARSAGAARTIAVATSAVREATNGEEVVETVRRASGLDLEVITGDEEARYAFLGSIHGLEADSGLVADVGGGSLELSRFSGRRLERAWTLPLGALRVSDRFLQDDPPAGSDLELLRAYAAGSLEQAGIPALGSKEVMVGTGGTIRNLAKLDHRSRSYPIRRLHGYVLPRKRIQELEEVMAGRRSTRRAAMAGLNKDRADSIVGGAVTLLVLMEAAGADQVIVSGQGLREGVAFHAIGEEPPPVAEVRASSLRAVASRFSTWDERRAARRAEIASGLLAAVEPDATGAARERIRHAATILDAGTSVDYYQRHRHAAQIVTEADLEGFSHRKLAMLAAVIRSAGDDGVSWREYRPLLSSDDRTPVARQATILAVADEIEHRLEPDAPATGLREDRRKTVVLWAPVFDPLKRESLARRFARVFGKRLEIRTDQGAPDA